MKFIFNFIFYGIIIFLLWRFLSDTFPDRFPDAFDAILSWLNSLYDVIKDLVVLGIEKLKELTPAKGNG